MDRSPVGRGAIGRLDRPLSPAVALRAGAARRRANDARPSRYSLRRLRARAAPVEQALGELWRRRRLRLALALAALLAVLVSCGWLWLRHSSLASVQRVQITGAHGPDAAAIDAALSAAARQQSTLDVHVGALRAAVAPFAVVRDVRASASFPHGLRIQVFEQPPVAALLALGTRTAVAADGVVLGPSLLSGSLPTLNGSSLPAPGKRVSDRTLRVALAVIGAAPASLARLISRAYAGRQGVTVVMRNGLKAYFGDSARPHAKWIALALVLANERSAGASYIDVRVPERPAAGFAPGAAPPSSSSETSGSGAAGSEPAMGPEASTAALAAGLAKALGKEQPPGSPPQGAGSTEEARSSSGAEAGRSTGAGSERTSAARGEASSGEASGGAASERGAGSGAHPEAGAETAPEAGAGGH